MRSAVIPAAAVIRMTAGEAGRSVFRRSSTVEGGAGNYAT